MAKQKSNKATPKSLIEDTAASAEEKIARLLALNAIRGLSSSDQVTLLRSVGFSTSEVAKLLLISENYVSVALHSTKKALEKGNKPKYLRSNSNGEI